MRHLILAALVLLATCAFAGQWKYGGDVRVRAYDLQNVWDWSYYNDADHWSAVRLRTHLWAGVELERGVSAMVRLGNQNWGEGVTDAEGGEKDGMSGKFFVDAAYVEVDRIFELPANLRLGRQALAYGSGFAVFDGQSQVGSTAVYFDGARLRLGSSPRWRLDLLWVLDQENRRDDSVPDDVSLMGAYFTHDATPEVYLLRRQDQFLDKDIWLAGVRLAHTHACGLDYSLEGGLQRGQSALDRDQEAWGLKTEVGFALADLPAHPRVFAGFVGLSGDDPATTDVCERWDVFYGGWPQFGEHLAWTYMNRGAGNGITRYDSGYNQLSSQLGEAVYSNLLMPAVGIELAPHPRLTGRLSYAWLTAESVVPGIADEIGTYSQVQAKYSYTSNLAFSFYGGYIEPGDALGPGAAPQYLAFLDAEVTF